MGSDPAPCLQRLEAALAEIPQQGAEQGVSVASGFTLLGNTRHGHGWVTPIGLDLC